MILDKLKYGAINNKKILTSLVVLLVVAITAGSLFLTILSKTDQQLVTQYMNDFMTQIMNHKVDYISTLKNSIWNNVGYVVFIWLLGISIIGLPIVLFFFFSKIFVLGFSIGSFVLTYRFKGLLCATIYIIPFSIINIGVYILLALYAIKMSNNLIYSIFKKKEINVKKIINRYLLILLISIGMMLFYSLYETFVIPFLFEKMKFLIK